MYRRFHVLVFRLIVCICPSFEQPWCNWGVSCRKRRQANFLYLLWKLILEISGLFTSDFCRYFCALFADWWHYNFFLVALPSAWIYLLYIYYHWFYEFIISAFKLGKRYLVPLMSDPWCVYLQAKDDYSTNYLRYNISRVQNSPPQIWIFLIENNILYCLAYSSALQLLQVGIAVTTD